MSEMPRAICFVAPSFIMELDYRFAHKQCPALARKGFEVSYFVKSNTSGDINGVRVFPVKLEKTKLGQALLPWKLLRRILKQPCGAYHLSNVELLPIALVLKLITKRRVVFDFREDYIELVRVKPYLKWPLKWLAVGLTRFLIWLVCKSADGIIFGDEGVLESYPSIPEKRVMLVHHFPLLSLFGPNPIPFSERKYDVVYLGTMSKTGGIFVMLEALSILKQRKKDLKVLLIGQPVEYIEEEFSNFVKEKTLEDALDITGKVPYTEVPELLHQAKVGLIGLTDLPKFHKQSATKLFEYMAKGIPCVSVDLPPERRFMVSGEQGYLVPPENPQAMANAVFQIISEPRLGQKMAEKCRETFMQKKYYAENELDKLAEFYHYVFNRPRKLLSGSR